MIIFSCREMWLPKAPIITEGGGRERKREKEGEKRLTIPGHKGNANQNHIKIPCHSC
jgi:hypothetical protein